MFPVPFLSNWFSNWYKGLCLVWFVCLIHCYINIVGMGLEIKVLRVISLNSICYPQHNTLGVSFIPLFYCSSVTIHALLSCS